MSIRLSGLTNENFLMEVIMCMEGQGKIDWEAVSQRTGYSKGGASNKYSAMKKAYNAAKAADAATAATTTPATSATTTPKSAKKRKPEDEPTKTAKAAKTPRSSKEQAKADADEED